jgi:hypothetical protein
MAEMKEITCKCGCGRKKVVYVSDIKRGFGMYYNHSCASRHRMPLKNGSTNFINKSKTDKVSLIFTAWLKSHVKCLTNRGIKS